jgi:hypothetical protein
MLDTAMTIVGCFYRLVRARCPSRPCRLASASFGREDATLNHDLAFEFLRAYNAYGACAACRFLVITCDGRTRKASAMEWSLFVPYLRYALISIAFWRFRQV